MVQNPLLPFSSIAMSGNSRSTRSSETTENSLEQSIVLSCPPCPTENSHDPRISSYIQLAGVSALILVQKENKTRSTTQRKENIILSFFSARSSDLHVIGAVTYAFFKVYRMSRVFLGGHSRTKNTPVGLWRYKTNFIRKDYLKNHDNIFKKIMAKLTQFYQILI